MKFFDLEMDDCLAGGLNKKKGGSRDIQFQKVVNGRCTVAIYHGSDSFMACGQSLFTSEKDCGQATIIECH